MSSKPYKKWKPSWSDEQLRADLEKYYARDWARALKAYEKHPKDFFSAWVFLYHHPANQVRQEFKNGPALGPDSMFEQNLDIMVVKVDPTTERIEDRWKGKGKNKRSLGEDRKRNTAVRVWLEWGPWMTAPELEKHSPGITFDRGMPSHDYRVDTGAPTFERAIVNLAHNIWMLYKDQPDTPAGAKLKKKDRW